MECNSEIIMGKFRQKKVLVLGSNVGSCDIVNYAKDNGAYTIVADYLQEKDSPAKIIANESILLSTGNIESLVKFVTDNKIDAILSGVSEFNILNAMEISKLSNLPFYCNKSQWDVVEHKDQFRFLCNKFNIPTPNTYFCGSIAEFDINIVTNYPVVVKPIDGSSSIGVFICNSKLELEEKIIISSKESMSGEIIIEDFFEGDEFSVHYTIVNGESYLSSMDNRYPIKINNGNVTSIPIARIYPSRFLQEYVKQVDSNMKELCNSLKLKTGVLFIQGLYNEKTNTFAIFEAGLRSAGEAPYRIIEKLNRNNYLKNMVDEALLGRVTNFDPLREDPMFNNKICAVISLVSKGGVIGNITGFDEIEKKVSSIIDKECRYSVGAVVPIGNTLKQIVIRFVLICNSVSELISDIEKINSNVNIYSTNGEDMCLKFNTQLL